MPITPGDDSYRGYGATILSPNGEIRVALAMGNDKEAYIFSITGLIFV